MCFSVLLGGTLMLMIMERIRSVGDDINIHAHKLGAMNGKMLNV